MTITLFDLPIEIMLNVANRLRPEDLGRLEQSSKYLQSIAQLPELWKQFLESDFQDATDPKSVFINDLTKRHPNYLEADKKGKAFVRLHRLQHAREYLEKKSIRSVGPRGIDLLTDETICNYIASGHINVKDLYKLFVSSYGVVKLHMILSNEENVGKLFEQGLLTIQQMISTPIPTLQSINKDIAAYEKLMPQTPSDDGEERNSKRPRLNNGKEEI